MHRNRQTVALVLIFVFSAISTGFCARDTTYSDTRLVPRSKLSPPEKTSTKNSSHNDDEDECGCLCILCNDFFSEFFSSIFQSLFSTISSPDPVTLTVSRGGLGFNLLEFVHYPSASLSYSIKLNGGIHFLVNEHMVIREYAQASVSYGATFFSDYERDVFLVDERIGQQTDLGQSYTNHSITLLTELLFRPSGENGHFFLTIGAGPRIVFEKTSLIREYSFSNLKENITVYNRSIIPALSFGIGRLYSTSEDFYGTIEFKYSLGLNRPSRQRSLPSDNALFLHGFSVLEFTFGY